MIAPSLRLRLLGASAEAPLVEAGCDWAPLPLPPTCAAGGASGRPPQPGRAGGGLLAARPPPPGVSAKVTVKKSERLKQPICFGCMVQHRTTRERPASFNLTSVRTSSGARAMQCEPSCLWPDQGIGPMLPCGQPRFGGWPGCAVRLGPLDPCVVRPWQAEAHVDRKQWSPTGTVGIVVSEVKFLDHSRTPYSEGTRFVLAPQSKN